MLKTSTGDVIDHRRAIFPLISFKHAHPIGTFRCLGTGFFIHQDGWFVTAKHTLVEKEKLIPMPMGLQTLSTGGVISRTVRYIHAHSEADIAIGKLGEGRDPLTALEVDIEQAPHFSASYAKLVLNSQIISYGYPNTKKTINDNLETFTGNGTWSEGYVQEYHEKGNSLLKNRCYQTTLKIESGASGGPVFQESSLVGVNSTGFDLLDGGQPLSFITPIDYILDLSVPFEGNQIVTLRDLVTKGAF